MAAVAALIFRKNPLNPLERDVVPLEAGARPIDWLVANFPHGCGGRVYHYHNDELLEAPRYDDEGLELEPGHPEYLERPAGAGDIITLAVFPGEFVTWTMIITAIVVAVVSAAVSIGLALLFPDPAAPSAAEMDGPGTASPAYNVRSRQNTARLGEPVPVQYGRVLMTPDLIAQPCRTFDPPRGMHIDLILCLGQGVYDVHNVIIGETPMDRIEGGAAQYIVVPPAAHGGVFGNLYNITQAHGWAGNFYENPWTSAEVGEQRFTNATESSGFYLVGRAGVVVGSAIQILLEWPRGLYQMAEWGSPVGTWVDWDVYVDEADANGNPVPGTRQEFNYSINGGSIDPRRETFVINLGRPAAWLVKIYRRTDKEPNGDEMNEFYWRGLTLAAGAQQGQAYGNATLVLVRLHASQVASSAERQVRVDCTRRLPILGSGAPAQTRNPADAFADIMCNTDYGAGRPLAEVDTARLAALRAYWGSYGFNAVYTQRTTVWEALAQVCQVVAATPLPVGGLMSIAQDGVRPVRSMMFSEQNIVKNSFSLTYHFEPTGAADGIEIAYVDPATWSPAYARYPANSVSPDRMTLFGCAEINHAHQFARLQWQRRQKLRRLVQFSTELEGLIPTPGERVAVAHTLPRWGVSGLVAAVAFDGVNIELDRELPWDEVAGPWYMMFRDERSGASAIVQAFPGGTERHATLASSPWGAGQAWRLEPTQERTHFAWGDGSRVVRDFTLTTLAPKGGRTVDVSGVIYDPAVYTLTLSFLANPVP